jgi:hypothetical protein
LKTADPDQTSGRGIIVRNQLANVLELVESYRQSGKTRARFARERRLHPSTFSRILRVSELPPELLLELAKLPRLSRTHVEVIATAPPERRAAVIDAIKSGSSTYKIRDRRETTSVALEAPSTSTPSAAGEGALAPIARALASSPEETLAFASELLLVLWRSGRDRVEESFRAFRAARGGLPA